MPLYTTLQNPFSVASTSGSLSARSEFKRFLPRSQQARPLSNSIARTQSAADKVLVGSVTTSATVTRCDVSWRGIRPFGILHGRSGSDFRFSTQHSATVIRVSAFRPDCVPQQSLECGQGVVSTYHSGSAHETGLVLPQPATHDQER